MEFTLNLVDTPFDLSHTLESGQVFRWELKEGWWYGIVDSGVVKIRQDGYSLTCLSSTDEIGPAYIREYLRLEEDLQGVLGTIMKDKVITEAVQRFYGLRIVRQPTWECLISFVIATNSNIPNIRRMISRICERFGDEVSFEGLRYRLFPSSESIAGARVSDLVTCGLGYRARFVKSVAEAVHEGRINLSELLLFDYPRAKELLLRSLFGKKTLLGIGPKVADCILLFSCEKSEAFPIDVWIARAVAKYYPTQIGEKLGKKLESRLSRKSTLSLKDYDSITGAMREYFGKYAGYAQQYLYLLSRTSSNSSK